VRAINVCVHLAHARSSIRAVHAIMRSHEWDRFPTGNFPATAYFRECCRDILEQARLSTNDGGVGTGAGGPCWSHDALGAEYIPATKLHICALITHTFD
jgi:hypothetical protein